MTMAPFTEARHRVIIIYTCARIPNTYTRVHIFQSDSSFIIKTTHERNAAEDFAFLVVFFLCVCVFFFSILRRFVVSDVVLTSCDRVPPRVTADINIGGGISQFDARREKRA